MNAISSINNNYRVAMKSNDSTQRMASAPYYNIMEEPEKKNSTNFLPIALGVLGAIGIGFGIYKHRQVSGLKDEVAKLTKEAADNKKALTEKNSLLETAQEALETAKNKLKELEEPAKEAVEKAKEAVKEGAEKVKDTVKESAEKVKDTVKEGAEKIKKDGFFKKIGNWFKGLFNKGEKASKA